MLSISSPYKKKLYGWLSYAFARCFPTSPSSRAASTNKTICGNSEVFVIVSLTLFLPICLEQFARDNGYLSPDRTQPCSVIKPIPLHVNATNASVVDDAGVALSDAGRCEVRIGWVWIDTASFRCVISYLVSTWC